LALAASAASGRPVWAQPAVEVRDALGRVVRLARPAERIVLGFNFEEFTAIARPAGWRRVVGYSRVQWAVNRAANWRRYAAVIPGLAGLPDVGTTEDSSFSIEQVLALRPDLVILPQWSFDALGVAVRQFEALGIAVLVIDYNSEIPDRHVASTLAMGAATDASARAAALAAFYRDGIGDIARRTAGVQPAKVYVELGMGGPGIIGNSYNKGMWGRLLDLIGADNIARDHVPGAWGPLSPEYVLAADPYAIFIAGSSWANQPSAVRTGYDVDPATLRRSLAPYLERPGWSGLSAVRAGRVYAIEHGLARSLTDVIAMQFIAKALYPARFADVDPEANLRRYHETYLPIRFEGTWMGSVA